MRDESYRALGCMADEQSPNSAPGRFGDVTSTKLVADRTSAVYSSQKAALEASEIRNLITQAHWPGELRDDQKAFALSPLAKDGVAPFATDRPTLFTRPENLLRVVEFLRSDSAFQLDFLLDLTAVDLLGSPREQDNTENLGKRFQVVYLLRSMLPERRAASLRLCVPVDENEEVPSLIDLYSGANWPEREVFDLMGIRFSGHPNLSRIVLPDNYRGHPLRKDFPVKGIGEDYLIEDLLYKRRNVD